MAVKLERQMRENVSVDKLISPVFYEDLIDMLMYKYSYMWKVS